MLGTIYKLGPGPHQLARQLGLAVAVIGLTGVIAARYTLGRSFSVTAKATALVTTGIYSKIRNPIYISGMFFIAGVLIMIRRPEMLVVFVLLIPMQILRARREAAVLEAKFGDAYREYRKQTWF
jgi:protein-S-isoprenylcysteine O-methyltransferase Ste14